MFNLNFATIFLMSTKGDLHTLAINKFLKISLFQIIRFVLSVIQQDFITKRNEAVLS